MEKSLDEVTTPVSPQQVVEVGRAEALATDLGNMLAIPPLEVSHDEWRQFNTGQAKRITLGDRMFAFRRSIGFGTLERLFLAEFEGVAIDALETPDLSFPLIRQDIPLRAIGAALARHCELQGNGVVRVLRFLVRQSMRTREGTPVNYNLLIGPAGELAHSQSKHIEELEGQDWAEALASSPETALKVDDSGVVTSAIDLRGTSIREADGMFVDAFRLPAAWTNESRRLAITLTRAREVLIHAAGELTFFMRQGSWHLAPLQRLSGGRWGSGWSFGELVVKSAAIASILDASFAHHGACLAVVSSGRSSDFENQNLIASSDRWNAREHQWAHLLQESRYGNPIYFERIPRRIRLELLSIDGATVISHTGELLGAGVIVQVPSGSDEGGRMAAARALAQYGAAVKVSQDGPVTLLGRSSDESTPASTLLKFG